ncbi:hypothetical protein KH5H1_22400 [Corallococcus caeni]|uniref:Lipoprotein n=1 Tax=Corallococcus exercitus TaxID=2316736 RepID=A0A7Y4JWN7_9BACT|nr:hypothetical protein [Corallococcus exercitus]NOK12479.1 hypothetical protein [Corallococcus exercitus]GMT98121.1 hypothetical protein KH5H1_22400 [Corallococcus sp. KH5-1]
MKASKLFLASAMAALAVACGPAPEEGMGEETQTPAVTDAQQQDVPVPPLVSVADYAGDSGEGREVNAMAVCTGWNYNYCLTTCAGDPSNTLYVVGYYSDPYVGGYGRCIEASDSFCLYYFGTVRRSACWGYP